MNEASIPLTPVQWKFILHWGEMSTRWGINRTVAQIHGLLYVCSRPLSAEEIARTLNIARSNVSTSLKELQSWGVVRLVHVMDDKRDHFECMKDVWAMFRVVLDERKRREIDPTVSLLRECVADAESHPDCDPYTRDRLKELHDFFVTTTAWYEQVRRWPTDILLRLMKLGDRARRVLSLVRGREGAEPPHGKPRD